MSANAFDEIDILRRKVNQLITLHTHAARREAIARDAMRGMLAASSYRPTLARLALQSSRQPASQHRATEGA